MIRRWLERGAWAVTAVLGGVGILSRPSLLEEEESAGGPPTAPGTESQAVDSIPAWSGLIIGGNPFRLSRRPPQRRHGAPAPDTVSGPEAPAIQLVLLGVAGGPPWQAVITGFPELPGSRVVRPGERVGAYSVIRIVRDTVVLQGPDSTLRLTVESS